MRHAPCAPACHALQVDMRIVLRGEGTEEHRLAGHQHVRVLVERQAKKRGGLREEAREDVTAGTIGSEHSRAGRE